MQKRHHLGEWVGEVGYLYGGTQQDQTTDLDDLSTVTHDSVKK